MRKYEVHDRRCLFDDFFRIVEAHLSFERFDGTMNPAIRRLVFERGDSTAAVVLNRNTDRLLLVEQIRFPTLDKGPGWVVEVMAGMVDERESPQTSLERELEEELGYRAERIEHISTFYTSPGGSSERIWLYLVEVSEDSRVSGGGGEPEEGEDIRILEVTFDEARAMLARGEILDAKTIIGLQWLLARQSDLPTQSTRRDE